MRLIYRGVGYEYTNPSLEVRESDLITRDRAAQQRCHTLQERNYPLIYRGARYTTAQVGSALAAPKVSSSQPLIYRGVKYTRDAGGKLQIGSNAVKSTVPATAIGATKQISRVHRENLRLNLERRLQSAQTRGDQTLVSLLEAESKELAL